MGNKCCSDDRDPSISCPPCDMEAPLMSEKATPSSKQESRADSRLATSLANTGNMSPFSLTNSPKVGSFKELAKDWKPRFCMNSPSSKLKQPSLMKSTGFNMEIQPNTVTSSNLKVCPRGDSEASQSPAKNDAMEMSSTNDSDDRMTNESLHLSLEKVTRENECLRNQLKCAHNLINNYQNIVVTYSKENMLLRDLGHSENELLSERSFDCISVSTRSAASPEPPQLICG